MSVTTLKFLLFAAAFVTIATVLTPMIMGTAPEDIDVEFATGDEATLYVMNTPTGYTRTLFILNPSGNTVITELEFYFYADHDSTKYFGSTENNFTLYVEIRDPNTGNTDNAQYDNFDITVRTGPYDLQFGQAYLENINSSWSEEHDVVVKVRHERAEGAGDVYWTFPIKCKAVIVSEGTNFFAWMAGGVGNIGSEIAGAVAGVVTGAATAVLGEDFVATLGNMLTMNFTGLPTAIRLIIAIPIWFGIGYVMFLIIRSLIPFLGGPPP